MIPTSIIRQILLLLLIAALFGLIFWNLILFVPAILGAYTLYVLLYKPTRYLAEVRNWSHGMAVGSMMLLSFIIILLPVNGFIWVLSTKVMDALSNTEKIIKPLELAIRKFEKLIDIRLLTTDRIQQLSEWGVMEVSKIVNATLFGFLILLITYFILWFMLMEGKKMERALFETLPFRERSTDYVRKELHYLVYSNAIGIPLMGIVQGFAGLIGYWLAGVEDLWFWVFMTFIAGMTPFFGVLLAVIPLSLVLFSKGLNAQAAFILIYGLVVIGSIDNLARMWLLNKLGQTHPLITLFGVIIGLQLFGFVGFIFGPIMITMFLLLIKIYINEFK
jgi:predicted PurR-regulated permease PerM